LELAERVATGIAEHARKLPAEALPGETKPEQAG
jgi:hypothetical protein